MSPRQEENNSIMEDPTTTTTSTAKTIRVLVVGAGPGGLLAAINLLRRNENTANNKNVKYHVTLVDPGVDYGALDEEGLSKHRSWMIGLTSHGTSAIQEIPGLYKDYVEQLGVLITKVTTGMGRWNFTQTLDANDPSGFCVDRNYVCAALARYLTETFGAKKSDCYRPLYLTRALFVDGENKQVMVRSVHNPGEPMTSLEYDVLLGCDGIRSIVRNAFITNHRDFEFDIEGAFGIYKSTHLTLPKDVDEGHFMFLLNPMPEVAAFVLPERGRKLNVAFGWNLNQTVDPALYSDDPKVVAAFAKKHFQNFDMDCNEFAEQWTQQAFQSTQMVHCNFYHSHKLQALLLGDAAHATVPNLGQGMNTALEDASVLNRLLDTHQDNWEQVLTAFSEERVKEGNALTELSYHTFCNDPWMMISIIVRQNLHRFFNKFLPTWLLEPEPINEVSNGMKLSVAYDKMVQYGYMAKSRRKNQDIKRAYFEKQVGLVQK
jgi:2-polyprenyl-6-methoxyphenol hydroxylase-like FAD-dependent oxidoreductase